MLRSGNVVNKKYHEVLRDKDKRMVCLALRSKDASIISKFRSQ